MDDGRRPVAEGRRPGRAADAGRPQLVEQRVLRVAPAVGRAAVEDRRLAGLERERQVAPQVGELVRDRAEDAVVVEAGLADRDDPRVGGPVDDPRPARVVDLGRVVRMDADRGVEPRRTGRRARARARSRPTFQPGTRIRSTPASARAADDLVDVVLEAIGVEVAVAVDQAHRRIVPVAIARCAERCARQAGGRRLPEADLAALRVADRGVATLARDHRSAA